MNSSWNRHNLLDAQQVPARVFPRMSHTFDPHKIKDAGMFVKRLYSRYSSTHPYHEHNIAVEGELQRVQIEQVI